MKNEKTEKKRGFFNALLSKIRPVKEKEPEKGGEKKKSGSGGTF